MTILKNIFFIVVILLTGILSALVGNVSADVQQQSTLKAVIDAQKHENLVLVPDAVTRSENLMYVANLSYKVNGKRYYPEREIKPFQEVGLASWYGGGFHGRATTSGERYDMHEMTAAHKTLPIPSYVKVRNLENGKEVVVRINDRGPFHGNRIIDLSYAAAKKLGYVQQGVANVKIEQIIPQKKRDKKTIFYALLKEFKQLPDAQNYMQNMVQVLPIEQMDKNIALIRANDYYQIRLGPFYSDEWKKFSQEQSGKY